MPARPGRPRRTGHGETGDGSGPNLPAQPTVRARSHVKPHMPEAQRTRGITSPVSKTQSRNLIPWTCHYQHLELHLSTHVSSHAMETGSPPGTETLAADHGSREGFCRFDPSGHGNRSGVWPSYPIPICVATGIDQGWCPLLVVSSAWYGSRGRRVSLLLEHCDGWNM